MTRTMIVHRDRASRRLLHRPGAVEDPRGFFARAWSDEELAGRGLETRFAQCNLSLTKRSGTVRGMHFQRPPHEEAKFVRCTAGAGCTT